MKKIEKALTLTLASLMLLGATACGGGGASLVAKDAITDREAHYVSEDKTLHKRTVNESNKVFAENKSTAYSLVVKNKGTQMDAANFIFTHVREATGASLTFTEEAVWSESAKYIVLGDEDMFKSAGLAMPSDNIGNVGYYVKTAGNSVFIMAKSAEGYQLGAIALLQELLGYDMLTADCVIYEKDGKTLPNMEIIERPDFDVRVVSNIMTKSQAYGMGYSGNSTATGIIAPEKTFVHNSFVWLPPATYNDPAKEATYNPDWYSDILYVGNGKEYRQICYTAHGKQAEYEEMQNLVVEKMLKVIDEQPNEYFITFTQEDVAYHCQCDSCLAVVDAYGVYSAAIIMFINDLSDKLQVALQEVADERGTEKRDITLAFFAYHVSEAPPAEKNANGSFGAIDPEGQKTYVDLNGKIKQEDWEALHCGEKVAVFIAPIYAKYNRSLYDEINVSYKENIEGWTTISDTILMWLYQTNYAQYLYPYNTWDSQVENYRLCKDAGAVYMFNEGQYEQAVVTHFTRLKEYIDSKALIDVNLDQNAATDKFFKYYFLDAEKPMRQFFDELQAHMTYLETEYSASLTGHIRDQINKSIYWPQRKIEGWLGLIDQAYAAIEKYKTTDPTTYEMLYEHILIESIFPRYVICSLHTNSVSSETLKQMRKDFYMDCVTLNITKIYEHTSIDGVFKDWGVI